MSVNRYTSTNEIVGQFLPRVYTRRFTIEDIRTFTPKESETSLTIDYHIKDVLDSNGLGVITRTRDDGDPSDLQEEILQALKVAIIVFANAEESASAARVINSLQDYSPEGMPFRAALNQYLQAIQRNGATIAMKINDARPSELGFEFRNTIYQQYDIDNNIVNIIPYSHKFKLDNKVWNDCNDLSVICFTYFDFESLQLASDGLSSNNSTELGYLLGDLTYDVVTSGGKIESTAVVYKIRDTNQPYSGPVHYHTEEDPGPGGYIGWMAGYEGADMGPKLNRVLVPATKVQDFRSFQRTKIVNYQPPQLEYFNSKSPGLSFIETRNKDYFRLTDVSVDFHRYQLAAFIEFTIDMGDIYKNNSRYFELMDTHPTMSSLYFSSMLLEMSEIRILRRRVTTMPDGVTKLGAPKRIKKFPYTEADYEVIRSVKVPNGNTIAENGEGLGHIRELDTNSTRFRSFLVKDYDIAKHDGQAVYQYGVEVRILDTTKDYLLQVVRRARNSLEELKRYAQECRIPVFDTYYVNSPEENAPIGLVTSPPSFAPAVKKGNFDTRTATFTKEFRQYARQKYDFEKYVKDFLQLVYFSFGKTSVAMTRKSIVSVQNDDTLQTPISSIESLGSIMEPGSEQNSQSLKNLLDGTNSRPETIDAFIYSFQDLVLEMEDFFDVDYTDGINNEGKGYTARSNLNFTLQRWFNSTDFGVDMDSFVHMRQSFSNRVYWDYGLTEEEDDDLETNIDRLSERLDSEMSTYGFSGDDLAVLAPTSISLGDTEVVWDKKELKKKKQKLLAAKEKLQRQQNTQRAKTKLEKLKKKKVVFMDRNDPKQVATIDGLVLGLARVQKQYGDRATSGFLSQMDNTPASNFMSAMFDFVHNITNNVTKVGTREITAAPLNKVTLDRTLDNTKSCGIIDNRPPIRKVPQNVFFEEDILKRYPDRLPGLNQTEFPSSETTIGPQLLSPEFPTGGIFDRSLRVLTSGGQPLTFNQAKATDAFAVKTKINIVALNTLKYNSIADNVNRNILGPKGPAPMGRRASRVEVASSHSGFKVRSGTRRTNSGGGQTNRSSSRGTQVRSRTAAVTPQFRRATTTSSAPRMARTSVPRSTTPRTGYSGY